MDRLAHPDESGNLATPNERDTSARPVAHGHLTVGITGTFDVENYGDLLFPLIAADALKRRDPRIRVEPFSVQGKSDSCWPFQVRTVEEMIESLSTLSAVLVGGGQIVRFDKLYPAPALGDIGLPFACWLTPAVLAALTGKPLIWNAVGASLRWPHAAWHDEALRQVFGASYFIGVRDVISRDELLKVAPEATIELLPDTAFGLSRLWPLEEESVEFKAWQKLLGLNRKYVVVQANAAVGKYRSTIEAQAASIGARAIVLAVCWWHGDRAEAFPELKGAILSREWLGPKLISEIIGRSEFVFASSLHACITALSYGVPVARTPLSSGGKFELLDEFEGIAFIEDRETLARLASRGRWIEPQVAQCADRLDRHWDHVAQVVLHPPVAHSNLSRTSMLFWVAKMCGDRRHQGLALRLAVKFRESLAGYFPIQRVALRHNLSRVRKLSLHAFRTIARIVRTRTAPLVAPQPEMKILPIHTNRIKAGK